ncbi:hypothetical protein MTO96_000071 [Rhipicephalus appendiculatus]
MHQRARLKRIPLYLFRIEKLRARTHAPLCPRQSEKGLRRSSHVRRQRPNHKERASPGRCHPIRGQSLRKRPVIQNEPAVDEAAAREAPPFKLFVVVTAAFATLSHPEQRGCRRRPAAAAHPLA